MSLKNYLFLLFNVILFTSTIFPTVLSNALIKTPRGLVKAENAAVGDNIIAYNRASLSATKITHITTTHCDKIIVLSTDKGSFYAAPDQLFFDPITEQWITAQDITTQTTFLNACFQRCPCHSIEIIDAPETKIIHITTTAPHTFFVTEQELLTHNAFPIVIGLAWLFGGGLEFLGISIGTAALGSYVGVQLYNAQKQKGQHCNVSLHVGPCGYPCPPDPNDENKERKFNTITKTEFFKMIKKDYERWRDNIYKRKSKAKGIEDAEYLEWDYTHNDVEAYSKAKRHIGSINPHTLKLYKLPVYNRQFPGR